jgi:phytol kinase
MLCFMNWWGVIVSFVFVFAVIGVAQLLLKAKLTNATVTRKLVHIGVSHWWFLAMLFFDRWQFAIIGPIAFILINLWSYLFRLFPAMEHEERTKNLGTVYFPIALLALVLFSWAGPMPTWVGGLGILVMGYGDGFASLFGERFARRSFRIYRTTKSYLGTLSMFVASFVVVAVFCLLFGSEIVGTGAQAALWIVLASLATAAVATAVEVFTPLGIDNLTVPILTSLFFFAVFV